MSRVKAASRRRGRALSKHQGRTQSKCEPGRTEVTQNLLVGLGGTCCLRFSKQLLIVLNSCKGFVLKVPNCVHKYCKLTIEGFVKLERSNPLCVCNTGVLNYGLWMCWSTWRKPFLFFWMYNFQSSFLKLVHSLFLGLNFLRRGNCVTFLLFGKRVN